MYPATYETSGSYGVAISFINDSPSAEFYEQKPFYRLYEIKHCAVDTCSGCDESHDCDHPLSTILGGGGLIIDSSPGADIVHGPTTPYIYLYTYISI